jgi:hypothetical protein
MPRARRNPWSVALGRVPPDLATGGRGIDSRRLRRNRAVTGGYEPSILERAKEAFDAASDALAALFRKAGLGPDETARRATLLMYAAKGAVILARAQRSIEPLVFTAKQLSTRPANERADPAADSR